MKSMRTLVPALALLAIAACNSSDTTSSSGGLTLADRIAIAGGLNDAAAAAIDSSGGNAMAGLALNLAAAGIIGGSDISDVNITTSGAAAVMAASTTHHAVAGQIIVTSGGTTDTAMVIVAFAGTTKYIFAGRLGIGSGDIPNPWFGGFFNKPNSSWVATGGSAGLTKNGETSACVGFTYQGATCTKATFNASLNITSSVPNAYTSNQATGSATANLGTATLNGFVIRYTQP